MNAAGGFSGRTPKLAVNIESAFVGRYVVDRLFRTTDGVRWIVDYKASRHEGANVEGFLDQELVRYSQQLQAYGSAMSRGSYFPLLRGWRHLPSTTE